MITKEYFVEGWHPFGALGFLKCNIMPSGTIFDSP
jgi:hypothetical protein